MASGSASRPLATGEKAGTDVRPRLGQGDPSATGCRPTSVNGRETKTARRGSFTTAPPQLLRKRSCQQNVTEDSEASQSSDAHCHNLSRCLRPALESLQTLVERSVSYSARCETGAQPSVSPEVAVHDDNTSYKGQSENTVRGVFVPCMAVT